jgi:hypothetical protein
MAVQSRKAQRRHENAEAFNRIDRERLAKRELEAKIARERASILARRTITSVRPDGSRWTYTAPAVFVPRGKRGPQDPYQMREALEAIKPHRDPTPHKPESIERYAARMARANALPDVGSQGITRCGRGRFAYDTVDWERLPDDANEGEPRADADLVAADEIAADHAVAATVGDFDILALVADQSCEVAVCPRCLGATPGHASGVPYRQHSGPFTPEICAPCAQTVHDNSERAVAATVRAETRPLHGAGAWSRRDQRVRIPVITLSEVA